LNKFALASYEMYCCAIPVKFIQFPTYLVLSSYTEMSAMAFHTLCNHRNAILFRVGHGSIFADPNQSKP